LNLFCIEMWELRKNKEDFYLGILFMIFTSKPSYIDVRYPKAAVIINLRPVWIIGIEFHSNNSNLGIYQLS
jgi:hypothetical protein